MPPSLTEQQWSGLLQESPEIQGQVLSKYKIGLTPDQLRTLKMESPDIQKQVYAKYSSEVAAETYRTGPKPSSEMTQPAPQPSPGPEQVALTPPISPVGGTSTITGRKVTPGDVNRELVGNRGIETLTKPIVRAPIEAARSLAFMAGGVSRGETQDNLFRFVDTTTKAIQALHPDADASFGEKFVDSAIGLVPYLATGGAGATSLLVNSATRGVDAINQGIDPKTAAKLAMKDLATTAIMFRLPMGGKTLPAGMAKGSVSNVGLDIASKAVEKGILTQADYKELAEKVKLIDPSLGQSTLMGMAFGAQQTLARQTVMPKEPMPARATGEPIISVQPKPIPASVYPVEGLKQPPGEVSRKSEMTRPALSETSRINGITKGEATDRLASGDSTVLPDIAEGVKTLGSSAMQDEMINGAMAKAKANGTLKDMAAIEPKLREVLRGETPVKTSENIPRATLRTLPEHEAIITQKTADMTPDDRAYALTHDHLTGLPNRKSLEESPDTSHLVILDIDGFKQVNDRFGHDAGNDYLVAIRKAAEDAGIPLHRLHGDEHAIPADSQEAGVSHARALDNALKNVIIEVTDTKTGEPFILQGAGFSYGIGEGETLNERFKSADKELYQHKEFRTEFGQRRPGVPAIPGDFPAEVSISPRGEGRGSENRPGESAVQGQAGQSQVTPHPEQEILAHAADMMSAKRGYQPATEFDTFMDARPAGWTYDKASEFLTKVSSGEVTPKTDAQKRLVKSAIEDVKYMNQREAEYNALPPTEREGFSLTSEPAKETKTTPAQAGLDLRTTGADLRAPERENKPVTIDELPLGKAMNEAADRAAQGTTLFSRRTEEPAPTFYHHSEKVISEKMPNKAIAPVVLSILNKNGVKADEMKWLGIEDWLKEQKRPVTKEEVLNFIKQNQVELKEVVKGGEGSADARWADYTRDDIEVHDREGKFVAYVGDEHIGDFSTKAKATTAAEDALKSAQETGPTKFSQYQIPGGTSYREMLLTLPKRDSYSYERAVQQENITFNKMAANPKDKALSDAFHEAQSKRQKMDVAEPSYKSSHWDEPNVLAHVRMNDRVDAQGKKVLFIEEVQSDWAAANRRALNEVTKPQSVRELADNLFGRGASSMMPLNARDGSVLSMTQHDQIKQAIIARIPVDVMDILKRVKVSPEQLFGNLSVLSDPVFGKSRGRILLAVLDATRSVGAELRAKVSDALSRRGDESLLPTMKASDLTAREVVGLLSPESIYHVGLSGDTSGGKVTGAGTEGFLRPREMAGGQSVSDSAMSADAKGRRSVTGEGAELLTGPAGPNRKNSTASLTSIIDWHNKILSQSGGSLQVKFIDAPFVGKTDAYVLLAMKRMIRMAAENGYDKIAWTTGEMQAARYDLSKQLERIDYKKTSSGEYWIRPVDLEGNYLKQLEKSYPADKLSDVVGKDAAEKIVSGSDANNKGSLTGLDLKIGGQGMKGFYDQILPAEVNKYVKKWGAKVGETKVPNGEEEFSGTEEQYLEGRPDLLTPSMVSVPSIDITPSMKDAVMTEGQPLFKKREEYQLASAAKDIQRTVKTITGRIPVLKDKIEVVKSESDLPKHIQEESQSRGFENSVEGVFDPKSGKVYVVSDNIFGKDRVEQVIKHELSHRGVRNIFGDKIKPAFQQIYKEFENKKEMSKIITDYDLNTDKEGHRLTAVDEFIARHGEQYQKQPVVQRMISMIRHELRKMGFKVSWTDKDIINLAGSALKSEGMGEDIRFSRKEKKEKSNLNTGEFNMKNPDIRFSRKNKLPEPIEGRADGGPVNAGQPYVIGERGPEILIPKQPGTVIPNAAIPAVMPAMPQPQAEQPPGRERQTAETLGQWAKRLYTMLSPISTAEAGELERGVSAVQNRKNVIDAAVGETAQVAQAAPTPVPQAAPESNQFAPANYKNSIDKATGKRINIQVQSTGQYRKWDDMNEQWIPINPAAITRYVIKE